MQELQPMLRLVTQSIRSMQKTLSCRKYDTKPTYNKTRHDIERRRYFRLSFYWNRSLRRIDIDGGGCWLGQRGMLWDSWFFWDGSGDFQSSKVTESEGCFIKNVFPMSRCLVSMSHNPQTHPTFIHIFMQRFSLSDLIHGSFFVMKAFVEQAFHKRESKH
jgi:hypothetical protein